MCEVHTLLVLKTLCVCNIFREMTALVIVAVRMRALPTEFHRVV